MRQDYGKNETDLSFFVCLFFDMAASKFHTVFTNVLLLFRETAAVKLTLRVSESVVQDLSSMTLFPQWKPCAEQGSTDGGRGGRLLGQPPGPAADGGLPSVTKLTCYLDDDS